MPFLATLIDQAAKTAVAALGATRFAAEFAAGQRLGRDSALVLAIGRPAAAPPAAAGVAGAISTGPLGNREVDVAGLVAEETCLATAIDASSRGHHVTFLRDASASRRRTEADAQAVHDVTIKAIGLFADITSTGHWLVATSQRQKGRRYG